jgi:hypothetical protein
LKEFKKYLSSFTEIENSTWTHIEDIFFETKINKNG